ncbi:GNAT family N-acetyltransferase [Roseomonas elaeocarpi]|uniref:N-acetyltransferase n=1 Tax=Roseomonas elaeocarpi TaxID=907779 RepID=A0ABV6JWX3_9PROT
MGAPVLRRAGSGCRGQVHPAGHTTLSTTIEVREVTGAAEAELWLALPSRLGGEAAGWTVPLLYESRRVFDPGFNTALSEWHLARLLAWRDGQAVGRLVVALPRDGATAGIGNFGFPALVQDPAVLRALLDAAAERLRRWGATAMRGPVSFSVNHEVGAQMPGGDGEPMLRMPRNPPWLTAMLDDPAANGGLGREQDVVACTLTVAEERHRARFAPVLAAWPGRDRLRVRGMNLARLGAEIAILRDIYTDAWARNWAAQSVSEAEAGVMRKLLTPLLGTGRVFFAEWDGVPIGLCSVVPNLEEVSQHLDGRLWPTGWAAMAGALMGRVGSARMPLLGVRQQWRGTTVSAMAVGAMLSRAIDLAERRGWGRLQISWILEDNAAMMATMRRLPAPETGRWRIWRRSLDGAAA